LRAKLTFYVLQSLLALCYTLGWNLLICAIECVGAGTERFPQYWTSRGIGWQVLIGVFIYGAIAGFSYSVQTRNRLHDKELLATRAEVLAATARMDAILSRLNPHFLFNALHTLSALAKLNSPTTERAFDRLGDLLRYALRDDARYLVEFSEEYAFTRDYLEFEQLRYEERLQVAYQIDPKSYEFEVPPFSIQALAENAVRHAISRNPAGGKIWISSTYGSGRLAVMVRDEGQSEEATSDEKSHRYGLNSLRTRLDSLFGPAASLTTIRGPNGFIASFEVPEHGEYEPQAAAEA
jgi:LytS/YehU family sensor histidine kinase